MTIFLPEKVLIYKFQDVLSESDKAMSVVKDLFGDDPKVNIKNLKKCFLTWFDFNIICFSYNFPILDLMDFSCRIVLHS